MQLLRLADVHEPSDSCEGNHCFSCGVDEPIYGRPHYLVCIECGHLYWRKRYLRRAHHRMMMKEWDHPTWRPTLWGDQFRLSYWQWLRSYLRRVGRIYSCPLCSHDF